MIPFELKGCIISLYIVPVSSAPFQFQGDEGIPFCLVTTDKET